MVYATPYDDLRFRYDGTWDRARFAQKHVLFPVQSPAYDCLHGLLSIAP